MTVIRASAAGLFPGIGFPQGCDIVTFDGIASLIAMATRVDDQPRYIGMEVVDSAHRRWRITGIHRTEPSPTPRWWQFWLNTPEPIELDVALEEIEPFGLDAARQRVIAHAAPLFEAGDLALAWVHAAATMAELSDACTSVMVRAANRRILRGEEEDAIRTAADVARRVLILFAVVRMSLRVDRLNILTWLDKHDLIHALSAKEAELFKTLRLSAERRAEAGWDIEGLTALLWALGRADIPGFGEFADDISAISDILPPSAQVGVTEFIAMAKLRSTREIALMTERWWAHLPAARDAGEDAHEVAYRRYAALQWIVNARDMGWA
ncbi:DUF4272 domain-containing protein [Rhizorhabdus argentea]|uniref:DUF4272 domain-containing protein n=1 Tax=Rhizorhabdus argentea TaxID=1387174 RepID=UPI0030EC8249